jgi:hypothetical protein
MRDSDAAPTLNARGGKVELLQEGLECLGYDVPAVERRSRHYGPGTAAAVQDLAARRSRRDGELRPEVDAVLKEALAKAGDWARVDGWICFERGLPAADIPVLAYNVRFGGKDRLLREGKTEPDGSYVLVYPQPNEPVNLEIRTLDRGKNEVSLSEPKLGAGVEETLNLVAPESVQPLLPEYERLAADVRGALGSANRLRKAKESDGQRDLGIVAEATGWDARLLALAATAEKLSAETNVPANGLYALLRVGLPAKPDELFRLHPKVVDRAWSKAVDAGIVKGGTGIAAARKAFRAHARSAFRNARADGTVSTFGELLAAAKLPGAEQAAWEDAYLSGATGSRLWSAARKNGVSEKSIEKLRLQGELAQLTLNNAPLAASLQAAVAGNGGSLAKLVDKGLYRPDAWKERLAKLAKNGVKLRDVIPPAYAGTQTSDRVEAYAADMARNVRLAFPTHVVGHMLQTGDLPLEHGKKVGSLLSKAADAGFELGRTPVDAFFRTKGNALLGPGDGADDLLGAVKTVWRIHQITPGDDALKTLLGAGLSSAQDVVDVDRETFVTRYGGTLGADAELVYRKAEQVVSTSQAIVASAQGIDSVPVSAISGNAERIKALKDAARESLVKHYPTMEELFGSLDFCECEHCRSVLSPAAYLVDLLRFLDPKQTTWDNFVSFWNASHAETFGPGGDYDKPYDQLAQRRPDIPNLPLTCENTNTTLPYIDVVNEILEYYVANQSYEGHESGDATTEQLLAEPQYVLPQAYAVLEGAHYPVGLPFDLWLETVRAFLSRLGVPLWQLLETFRPTDELYRPVGDLTPYFRSQVFAESLEISPAEWTLYTGGAAGSWWELYGYTSAMQAETALASAKTLARRLGVSYRELTELVRTQFVNPGLAELVLLSKAGIGLDEVYAFKKHGMNDFEQAAFIKILGDFKKRTGFDAKKWVDERYADRTLSRALVLAAPAVECNFERTRLVYADGTKAAPVDFVKLNLFVRLWRKLGGTISDLDQALTALIPANALPLTEANLGKALGSALIHLAHLNTLAKTLPIGSDARAVLTALWSDISTRGKGSIYAHLFLTPAVLRDDPVFDDPIGKYLTDPNVHLVEHQGAVQAALTLSAREVEQIAEDAGIALASAPLSVPNLSILYRYRLLARALDLSVDELIALKALSGLEPFGPLLAAGLDPDVPSLLVDDHPFSQTLRFVEVARLVAGGDFTIEELVYLLRHRLDPVGPYRADSRALLALVVELGTAITQIRSENAPPADAAALDDETLRRKLALVLPSDDVETFMGMWRGTIQYAAVLQNIAAANALDPEKMPREVSVAYDSVRQSQQLTFTGVLLQKRKDDLAPNPGALRSLLDDVQSQARGFVRDRLAELFPEARTGDFKAAEDVFEPVPTAPAQARAVLARKRSRIVERLFPVVRQRLTKQLIVRTRTSTLDTDPGLVEALLGDAGLLSDPDSPGEPLLDGFAAAAEVGVAARFYASSGGTGSPLSTKLVGEADTTKKPPSGSAHSARLGGVLEAPATGVFRFAVHVADPGTTVELRFAHLPDPVVAATAAAADFEPSAAVELRAGTAYGFQLDVDGLAGGDVSVLVEGASLPKGPLSRLRLHPEAAVERVRRADILLAKALRLITGLALDVREVRHLVAHPADFDSPSLSALPTSEIKAASAAANFSWFLRLAQYATVKRDLAIAGNDLIDVFENAQHPYDPATPAAAAETALLTDVQARVARLLRRSPEAVEETGKALRFGAKADAVAGLVKAPAYAQEQGLRRLWEALRMVETLGVPAGAVGRWTKIVDPATPKRDEIAKDLRNSLKARFSEDAWLAVAQPISDVLRRRKRDALVAYVLADPTRDFKHPDELYEFFLVDPATEPVVQVSRLALAISSVQLFVQRCLLNLEPRVPAHAISSEQWRWMKRYRVWEANRKIFLYPENWLDEEFRDGRTHLVTKLERSLLQGEVTNEAAEDAYFGYLKELEEIARLEMVSMYAEEHRNPDVTTLHVIGRTYATPHKYYYRRYAYGTWSPWEPVDVEIEGDHVAAVVWHGRLHVVWLTFQEKGEHVSPVETPQVPPPTTTEGMVGALAKRALAQTKVEDTVKRKVEIRLAWSECIDGNWMPPAATPTSTFIEYKFPAALDKSTVFTWVSKEQTTDGTEGALYVHVFHTEVAAWFSARFRTASKNSPPTVESGDHQLPPSDWVWPPDDWYSALGFNATRRDPGGLGILYSLKTGNHILDAAPQGGFELLLADNDLTLPSPEPGPLGPFFYQDERHTFFVEPRMVGRAADSWAGWAIDPSVDLRADEPDLVEIESVVPDLHVDPPEPLDPRARFAIRAPSDWVTASDSGIEFDGAVIGREGSVEDGNGPLLIGRRR